MKTRNGSFNRRLYTDSLYKVALADFFTVVIDRDTLKEVKWYEHQIGKTAEKGFIAYLDTDSLSVGEHILRLDWTNYNWKNEPYENNWLVIPFWKE